MNSVYVAQKRRVTVLRTEVGFSGRKSATKVLCAKTFSGKVVRHSMAYRTVHKGLIGDVLFHVKFWAK